MRPTAYKTIRMSNLDAFSHPVDIRTAGSLNNSSAKMTPLRRGWLVARANRASRKSLGASKASGRWSALSTGLSSKATTFAQGAKEAQLSGRPLRYLCCHLYSKWLLACSRWALGRSMQLVERARAHLASCTTLLELAGVKRES
jgi:hypothetical protein